MAPRTCKFNLSWLNEKDPNGHPIKNWGKPCANDNTSMYCCVCEKKVPVVRGMCAVSQHARG